MHGHHRFENPNIGWTESKNPRNDKTKAPATPIKSAYCRNLFEPFTSAIRFLSCRDQPKAAAAPKTGRGAGTDVEAVLSGVAVA